MGESTKPDELTMANLSKPGSALGTVGAVSTTEARLHGDAGKSSTAVWDIGGHHPGWAKRDAVVVVWLIQMTNVDPG